MALNVTSSTDEKVHIKLTPKTAGGKPAKVDGIPVWTLDGTGSIEVDADGLGAFLISADVAGSSTWSVTADADLGEGIVNISETGEYVYSDAQASSLGIVAEPAVPK